MNIKWGFPGRATLMVCQQLIRIECPPQDSVYKAWQQPVGHCHKHIWWPTSSGGLVTCIEIRGKNENHNRL